VTNGLLEESARLERARMEIYRKKRDRDDRGRKYAILCQEGKAKMLDKFEGEK